MKTRYLLHIAIPALVLATSSADIIEMKDGTVYHGTVVKKDGSDYVVEVQVSKSIKDERRIPQADVTRITPEDKSESDFTEIAALLPVPDLSTTAEYDARLKKAQNFLKTYKDSKHKADVQKITDTLGNESSAIGAGGVKFGGKVISVEERKPIAYTLDSQIAIANVKRLAEQGKIPAALRAWSVFEKDFAASAAYRDNLPYMIRLMQSQLAMVSQMLVDVPTVTKQREEGLKGLSDQQRSQSKKAIDEDAESYRKLAEAEKSQQIKWLTLNPFVKGPIEETKRSLDSEIKRLQAVVPTVKGDDAYAKAWEALKKEGATKQEITTALGEARSMSVPPAYLEILSSSSPIPLGNK
jgi:hypothetical protein